MNEEEKEAINNMKIFARAHQDMTIVTAEEMDIVLQLVERLQKENEELKKLIVEGITIETNSAYQNYQLSFLKENFIPVQKVKDKLEEYKKMLLSCNRFSDVDRIKAINERILELQELIEEKGE